MEANLNADSFCTQKMSDNLMLNVRITQLNEKIIFIWTRFTLLIKVIMKCNKLLTLRIFYLLLHRICSRKNI